MECEESAKQEKVMHFRPSVCLLCMDIYRIEGYVLGNAEPTTDLPVRNKDQ